MIVFPNAKINIGLYVTEKRNDGYHNIETIFMPVPLYDALEVVPAPNGISELHLQDGVLADEDKTNNLVWKAYHILLSHYEDKMYPIHLYLNKAIPMGAGLGGGSADATFTLKLLNDFFKLGLIPEEIASFALQIGSDCPFFAYNKPQFATGRGELLEEINLGIDWSHYSLLLVHLPVHISTQQAFQGIQPKTANFNLRDIAELPIEEWKNVIQNDFELAFSVHHPEALKLKSHLYQLGAIYVSLTGTGSTFYAIFPKDLRQNIDMSSVDYSMKWCDDLTIKN